MTLALGYIRRSVTKAGKPTLSPQRQQDGIAEYCQQRGWEVEYYSDAEGHRSGRTEQGRPEWQRLKRRIELAQPGEISAVVVYVLDRTARSGRDFLNFLHLLEQKRIDYVSVTQPFLDTTTAAGRAFVAMLAIWAQLEADIDSERISADIAYRQQSGLFVGHCPPGYSRQLVNGERLPAPNEHAPKVVELIERYLTGHWSYRQLARWANTLNWPTSGDGPWTHKHVRIVIEDAPFYAGFVTRHRKRGGGEMYKGKHQAIITVEQMERVEAMRTQRQSEWLGHRNEKAKAVYLLSSILYCAKCGCPMRGKLSHGQRVYQHNKRGCSYSLIDADLLEKQVLDYLRGWSVSADLEREILVEARQRLGSDVSDDAARQIQRLRQRRERALRLFEMGERDEDWLRLTLAEIDEELHRLRPPVQLSYNPAEIAQMIRNLHAFMSDPETPRELIRNILGTIFERLETDGGAITKMAPYPWFAQIYPRHHVPPREFDGTSWREV